MRSRVVGFLSSIPLIVASIWFCVWYIDLYCASVRGLWFHRSWATDDALQQVFPWHEAIRPGVFRGDLVYEVMKGYLAPLHYWLGMALTAATGSAIMAAHWVTLIQLVLTAVPLFLGVRALAGSTAGFVSVAWLFHTREIIQRMNGGLPRGWSGPVLAIFLWLVVTRRHRAVLALLVLGGLVHPPSTGLVGLAYGLLLATEWFFDRIGRPMFVANDGLTVTRRLVELVLVTPIVLGVNLAVVHRPPGVGQMVSYDEALTKPEFSRPFGRFPFVPLLSADEELRSYAFQAFVSRLYRAPLVMKRSGGELVVASLLLILLVAAIRKRNAVPRELWFCLIGSLVMYEASRLLAFKLYVPNRHLQFPLAIFSIAIFTAGIWRALHRGPDPRSSSLREAWGSALGLVLVGAFVAYGSGSGLRGPANFNYSMGKRGGVFEWLDRNTPQSALIAGEPTHIDAVQLFGARRGFATTETTHPFYDKYYKEMERRLVVSLRAHYATSASEILAFLEPEGVTYFVFSTRDFTPEALASARYFEPLNGLVRELASRDPSTYFYSTLPARVDPERAPYLVYRDKLSAIIDVAKLRKFLESSAT